LYCMVFDHFLSRTACLSHQVMLSFLGVLISWLYIQLLPLAQVMHVSSTCWSFFNSLHHCLSHQLIQ
jgi:hypothetical protein